MGEIGEQLVADVREALEKGFDGIQAALQEAAPDVQAAVTATIEQIRLDVRDAVQAYLDATAPE